MTSSHSVTEKEPGCPLYHYVEQYRHESHRPAHDLRLLRVSRRRIDRDLPSGGRRGWQYRHDRPDAAHDAPGGSLVLTLTMPLPGAQLPQKDYPIAAGISVSKEIGERYHVWSGDLVARRITCHSSKIEAFRNRRDGRARSRAGRSLLIVLPRQDLVSVGDAGCRNSGRKALTRMRPKPPSAPFNTYDAKTCPSVRRQAGGKPVLESLVGWKARPWPNTPTVSRLCWPRPAV